MDVQTRIEVDHDAAYALTADEAAVAALTALGADASATSVATIIRRPEASQAVGVVIQAEIALAPADRLAYTADECASELLIALGDDESADTCLASISMPQTRGQAGLPYPPVAG